MADDRTAVETARALESVRTELHSLARGQSVLESALSSVLRNSSIAASDAKGRAANGRDVVGRLFAAFQAEDRLVDEALTTVGGV